MKMLNERQIRALVEEFYTESPENVFGLFALADYVADLLGDDDDAVREQTLRVAKVLLIRGMLAGNSPYHPGDYKPWADQDQASVLRRIRSEWLQPGHRPTLHEIAWFGPPPRAGIG